MANILIVDDSNSMRQMVSFTLKGAGHHITEASDGVQGLTKTKGSQFDLIISDINMPNMDGIAMVKAVRQLPNYKFTPILMLTTESASHKKQEGKAAGATGWIIKPFNPNGLLTTVNKVLR
ncbi:response regulator [Ectothiorhodospiraceae bacterium BW-2]|nr:response regulator [Ectothiorhodospiraceae bacterium BW-2]